MQPLQRIVVVVDLEHEARPVFEAARLLAPSPTHLQVIALLPEEQGREALKPMLEAGPSLTWPALENVSFATIFDASRIIDMARSFHAQAVVMGPWARKRSPRSRALALLELTAAGVLVLSVGQRCGLVPNQVQVLGLALEGEAAQVVHLATAARAWGSATKVIAFVQGASPERLDALELALSSVFPDVPREVVPVAASSLNVADVVEREAASRQVDVLLASPGDASRLSALVTGLFAATMLQDAGRPVLIVPRSVEAASSVDRLSCADTVAAPELGLRITLERVGLLGRTPLQPTETFFVVGREALGALPHDEGVVTVPWSSFEQGAPSAVALVTHGHPTDVVSSRVVTAGAALLTVLVDAELPLESLADVEPLISQAVVLFVRLRANEALDTLRERLTGALPWGGSVTLLDASAWLDDGGATDVPAAVDGLRLMRLALRLAQSGLRIAAIVTREETRVTNEYLTTYSPATLRSRSPTSPALASRHQGRSSRELLTASHTEAGHQVTLEFDNRVAREALLTSIAQAKQRIHWQCYIVEDDLVAEGFMKALHEAGQRGVEVRVLVDALYSRHDAFGFTNPLLERLAKTPGIEVRGAQPLAGLPSLADLKQRNHKKLITIDNDVGIVSGRNLGAPYFTGFEEVPLKPLSSYRDVPWLDASARLQGPLVAALERSFLSDWQRAGGSGFTVRTPAKAGELNCRLVLHQGLGDTYTFETQLDLVERAQKRLVVVNTFPLVVELQRALVRAVKRGVRVQLLFGNVRPRWGAEQAFEGGALRELADDLVRARVEPVVAAGGEAFEVCMPVLPTWDATLQHVYPHVHAKLLVRDDAEVAIGSANVDVTSAYWESEVLLVVEDRAFAGETLTHLDALLAQARRVDLAGEAWRKEAVRRAWLGRNWPSLVG